MKDGFKTAQPGRVRQQVLRALRFKGFGLAGCGATCAQHKAADGAVGKAGQKACGGSGLFGHAAILKRAAHCPTACCNHSAGLAALQAMLKC